MRERGFLLRTGATRQTVVSQNEKKGPASRFWVSDAEPISFPINQPHPPQEGSTHVHNTITS